MNMDNRVQRRLSTFRPILDRALFGAALIGMLVTVHLFIQQGRGFDHGCLGFSTPSTAAEDCVVVAESEAGTVFGVSNAIWGFLYYAVIAGLSFVVLFVRGRRVRSLKRLRAMFVVAGFLYTAYLVYYQASVIEGFCELCLISAGVETVLLVLVAADWFGRKGSPETSRVPRLRSRVRELAAMGGLAVLVLILAGADFAYFNSRKDGADIETALQAAKQRAAARLDNQTCGYDPEKEAFLDYASLVGPQDPFAGNPDASVKVIEFFDPNCPHCRTMYGVLKEVSRENSGNAAFVYKVFVLWPFSVPQSAALYAAAEEGKFFEMLELQFDSMQRGGIRPEQLRTLAERAGLDPDLMMQRIESGRFLSTLEQVRAQGRQAGVTGLPAVMINGRWIDGRSRTVACLTQLIEDAVEQKDIDSKNKVDGHQ